MNDEERDWHRGRHYVRGRRIVERLTLSRDLTLGSLFSGIGGFELGMGRAGFRPLFQVEIDPFCQKVLSRHWPGVTRYGDIKTVDANILPKPDVLVGGFPCQDLSVAGKRKGLAGERSGLFFEFLRIADSMPAAWVLVENVPGLLSSADGADFATILGDLSGFFPVKPEDGWRNSGVCVGPKGCVAWRMLDAQYFGVAQRRRRVFIVRSPSRTGAFEVLFEPDCLPGNPAPSRKAQEEIAHALAYGTTQNHGDASQQTYVSHPLTARFDSSEDGSGRGVPLVCGPLSASGAGTARTGNERNEAHMIVAAGLKYSAEMTSAVRRLTPTECARLQGFPDDHCRLDNKTPDSPQYKAYGNAVCVNVAEWIGKRIKEAMNR